MEDLNLPYVIPSVSVGIKAKPHFATLDCHVATSLLLAMTNGKLTSNFSTCAHSALHQADNLAKLRFEFLSVFELIAQILCAVSDCENKCGFWQSPQKFLFLFRGFPRYALNDDVGD